jgi:hypothetical protein
MALGTDHMTVTTGNVFRPEVWSPEVLRATENALVMAPLVKRFDSLVTGKGDTINIPNLGNLSATDKSAQTQVSLQSPTESNTQILLNKHKESSFLIEDILKTQSNYDLNNIESFYGNVVEKVREFGEHRETTTPSRATSDCGRCNDYVRNFLMGKRDSLN